MALSRDERVQRDEMIKTRKAIEEISKSIPRLIAAFEGLAEGLRNAGAAAGEVKIVPADVAEKQLQAPSGVENDPGAEHRGWPARHADIPPVS